MIKSVLMAAVVFLPLIMAPVPKCGTIQGGEIEIALSPQGFGLQRVDYQTPVHCPVSIVVTPRAYNAEFTVHQYFVEPIDMQGFALGVRGEPGAVIRFMWQAVEYQSGHP